VGKELAFGALHIENVRKFKKSKLFVIWLSNEW